MISQKIKTVVGGLFHDIGKVALRAGNSIQEHPVLGSELMAEFIKESLSQPS